MGMEYFQVIIEQFPALDLVNVGLVAYVMTHSLNLYAIVFM